MCDTKGHEHWCSVCGKNLNKEPKDSYVEIEWLQNDKGQIIQEKSMVCNPCMEKSENIKELDKFFSELKYQPFGHIFCSSCKKDLTKELGKDIRSGEDYECIEFKQHKKGRGIKHIIRVVVLCKDCVKKEFHAENIHKLKKLGRNPRFEPMIACDKTDICRQYEKGDKNVNCRHIVMGRDRETLNLGLLCGRKHKGFIPLPFDDGFTIIRPRKGKGAAVANPIPVSTTTTGNMIKDYVTEIEKILKKYKLGPFGSQPSIDANSSIIKALDARISILERKLGLGSHEHVVNIELDDFDSTQKYDTEENDKETTVSIAQKCNVIDKA